MFKIHYPEITKKVKKDDVVCISKVDMSVYISLKSGYGHYVDEKLEEVVEKLKLYGKHDLKGVD